MFFGKRVLCLLLPVIVTQIFFGTVRAGSVESPKNLSQEVKYQNLLRSLQNPLLPEEFVAFTDFEPDLEKVDHNASLEYLSSRQDLIDRIRIDLGSEEIRWQLQGISFRILYVPESRTEVGGLFTDYCRDTINDLLDRTGLDNPYSSISILNENRVDNPGDQGIAAVIVQDLAREYVARYQFSGDTDKRIEIGLSGRQKINEVGSFSSYLQYSEEAKDWQFHRNQQTVWKSVSANPYTVLMTPLEETLHIALREYTEKAIISAVKAEAKQPSLQEIQQLVDEWLEVEEAIVGGLVYSLIPDLILKRIPDLPQEWIQNDLDTKSHFHKYRFLPKAIEIIRDYGLKEFIHSYAQDPIATRSLLNEPS